MLRETCVARDAADPLRALRDAFHLPRGAIYLDGNSLGPVPRSVPARIDRVLRQEWGADLIRSWNSAGWIELPARVGARIARLVGADADEVTATDSTSVNLFKCLSMALQLRPDRPVVVSERGNFPTDLYMVQGLAKLPGSRQVELRLVEETSIEAALGPDVAVLMLTEVDFRSGRLHDMKRLTRAAHAAGALVIWDLAHSAGALPVDLKDAGADFAVGCGYKYLNGGPGAPAFIFVRRDLQDLAQSPLSGWLGHAAPFDFAAEYRPAPGIARQLCGTPPILSLAALDAALDLFDGLDMRSVRAKSLALTGLFLDLADQRLVRHGLQPITPREEARRGSQVSLRHPEGYAIIQALIERGVIGDFRSPDILRFGFAPLYVGFADVFDAVEALDGIMVKSEYRRDAFRLRATVT